MVNTKEKAICLSPRVRFRAVGDEGVLVQIESGRVLVVNAVGLYLLPLLKTPVPRKTLVSALVEEFEVSPGQAAMDLDAFIDQLDQEQVLLRSETV